MRPLPSTIRLVALDLDGTVVGKDLSVSDRVIDVIAQARALGVRTTVVTGRMFSATIPFSKKLGITEPIVCFQGAGVYNPTTGEVLRHQPVAHKLVEKIIAFAEQHDIHLQLYAEGTYFVEKKTRFGAIYAYVCGIEPTIVSSLADRFTSTDSTKVVFVTDPDKAEALTADVRALCGTEAYVTRSNAEFVEVMAPGVDKGNALHFVAEKLGIAPHEILAVGDAWNDIPMLKAAAFGVAMGSAPAELKEIGDAVVADVAHDGVAEAYERFVLRTSVEASALLSKKIVRRRKKKRTLKSRVRQSFFVLLLLFVLLGWGSTYAVTWPGFRPHGVLINGAHVVTAQHIRDVANIDLETNIWVINPWAIDKRIDLIPYIDTAHVHRSFPNIIRIDVTERRPESCVEGAQHILMTIDATQRVLNQGCKAAPIYKLPAIAAVKPGFVIEDPQLARLRSTAAELVSGGVHLKDVSVDRDAGTVVDRADGVRLMLGDDTDLQEKIRLINPIMAAARTHDPNVEQLDLRAVDTPVVRYRGSQRNAQNRPAQ